LFEELESILKPNGLIFIIEPKFHVSKNSFEDMIKRIKSRGFDVINNPKVFFSRTVLLKSIKKDLRFLHNVSLQKGKS